jgi:DNA-binding transcriptional ArsR family regulator
MPAPRDAIRSPKQLRALASPTRQELLDVLPTLGVASVAEIAAVLGRPPDGLYYHLRARQRAGLVVPADKRVRAGRSEALFRTAAREPALHHDASPGGNSREVATIVASMLRLGARDFRRAVAGAGVRVSGPSRELWAIRATGWLTQSQVSEVNRRMLSLRESVARPRGKGRLFGITILLTPLDHRARKPQARPRLARRREAR